MPADKEYPMLSNKAADEKLVPLDILFDMNECLLWQRSTAFVLSDQSDVCKQNGLHIETELDKVLRRSAIFGCF